MPGTVLTVASGKGGVGKTTTAVNLAVALWREGNAVALVDADLGMANLAAVLGLEPESTLHDVLSGEATLEEAVVEAKDGDLLVLPGDRDLAGFADADPQALRSVLSDLADRCDYVIVDTGAGLSYEDVLPLGLADEVLLVTTPDPAAVGDTRKTLQLAGLLEGPIRGVVVTRAIDGTDAGSVAAEIGVELLGTIPEDPAVTESTMRADPLESHAPDAPATVAYRDLAATIAVAAGTTGESAGEAEQAEGKPAANAGGGTIDDLVTELGDVAGTGHDDGAVAHASGRDPSPDANEGGADDVPDAETGESVGSETGDPGGDGADEGESETEYGSESETQRDEAADEGGDEATKGDEDAAGTDDDGDTDEGGVDEAEDTDDTDAAETNDADDTGTNDTGTDRSETDDESEKRRGGFFGWLGRLFS